MSLTTYETDFLNSLLEEKREDFVEWCRKCFLSSYTNDERPAFHEYFLMLAFDVSLRSEDLHVKHGAIIVNKLPMHVIGTGYNATLRGSDKEVINLKDRDGRRPWMIHAEENAIMNCTKNPLELPQGALMYITGTPCVNCLQRVANFGIKEIYAAKRGGTSTDNEQTDKMRRDIIKMANLQITEVPLDNKWLRRVCL